MYTANEFMDIVHKRGIRGTKKVIQQWLMDHPKDTYTEDDIIDFYYASETPTLRRHIVSGLTEDGQNKCSMSAMGNSEPDPLWEIRHNYNIIETISERIRKEKEEGKRCTR